MAGFLSWLFLGKKSPKKSPGAPHAVSDRDQQIRNLTATADRVMTPERRELIRQALTIRKTKTKILDDLGDEQKRQLYALAIKTMMRNGGDDGK